MSIKSKIKANPFLHSFFKKLKQIVLFFQGYIIRLWMLFCWLHPVQSNKVVIVSYYGAGFGDHGKYVAKQLLKSGVPLQIFWAGKPGTEDTIPDGINYVKYNSLKFFFHLATAGVWVDNSRKDHCIIKRKNQLYIQAWHGAIALKQVEKDVQEHLSKHYVKSAIHDSKMADLMVSNSTFCTKMYRRAFWYDGEILECGSPRVDILFHITEDQKKEIKRKLGVGDDQSIILYAPTFRVDGNLDCYQIDFDAVLEKMRAISNTEWVFAIRLHPNISNKADFIQYSDRIINATTYPDMYELLAVADILITDYSSSMFEAGFAKKPVFLYASDIESYIKDRNFYFDLTSLPFPLAEDNEALLSSLQNFSREQYEQKLDAFNVSLGLKETGHASNTVAEKILERINEQ